MYLSDRVENVRLAGRVHEHKLGVLLLLLLQVPLEGQFLLILLFLRNRNIYDMCVWHVHGNLYATNQSTVYNHMDAVIMGSD